MTTRKRQIKSDAGLVITYCDTPERRALNLAKAGVPEVPVLGFSRYGHIVAPVKAHRHEACFEIGLCLRGALTLLSNAVEHRIMPGDLYLNKPDDTHCLTAHPKGTMIDWLLIRCPHGTRPFLRLSQAEASAVFDLLNKLPCHIIAKTGAVKQIFTQLFKWYDQPPSHYRTVCLNILSTSLLLHVIEAAAHENTLLHPQRMEEIIASLRLHPERTYSNDDLSRQALLSPSLFISQFKQLTGLPPHHFILACRLEEAKRLLVKTDKPITQIAFDLGFCASQHFSAHFKRAFGVTPLAWRKQAAATC